MPKVSVIIPIYGVEKYIERCARSLFEQTLDDIEYLFIDDCTPDRSIDILKFVLEDYPQRKTQVIIHRMEKNSGQAAVRKWGMMNATGKFVIHCDSDDWVDTNMYRAMYEKAVEDELDIVLCDFFRSNGEKHEIYKNGVDGLKSKDEYFRQLLTYRCPTSVWTKLVKRELYTKNDLLYPNDNMWEDFVLSIQLFYYAKKIGYLPEPFYYYYYNPSSISYSNIDKRQEQLMRNSAIILRFLKKEGIDVKNKDAVVYFKYMSRSELVRFTKEQKYLKFDLKEKIKFIAIYLGLYGALKRYKV